MVETKHFATTKYNDVWIFPVEMKVTAKQMKPLYTKSGQGRTKVTSLRGRQETKQTLLGYRSVFSRDDGRFFNTYDEALEFVRETLQQYVADAKHALEQEQERLELFSSCLLN